MTGDAASTGLAAWTRWMVSLDGPGVPTLLERSGLAILERTALGKLAPQLESDDPFENLFRFPWHPREQVL